jgi:hypothetical protein
MHSRRFHRTALLCSLCSDQPSCSRMAQSFSVPTRMNVTAVAISADLPVVNGDSLLASNFSMKRPQNATKHPNNAPTVEAQRTKPTPRRLGWLAGLDVAEVWLWRATVIASALAILRSAICHWLSTFTSGVSAAIDPMSTAMMVILLSVGMRVLDLLKCKNAHDGSRERRQRC